MVNTKKKGLLSAYLANVPLHMSVFCNFMAGVICRLMSAVFVAKSCDADDICAYSAAMLFTTIAINAATFIMCSAVSGKDHHRPAAATMIAGILVAFAAGAVFAPEILSLASHG